MQFNEIRDLKQQMCEIGRRIWIKGFCAGNEGNHSARIGPNRFLCTPTGISKGFLEPGDLLVCDAEGKQVEKNANGRRPTSEIKVHLAIYNARPEVNAVIHSHPPHATAFAIANIALPEGIHPEAEVFLGRVPTARYATPSTHDLPKSILDVMGPETNTVLMGNHGSVSFGKTLEQTYYNLEILDAYCRILILTKQLGQAKSLSQDQMIELLKVKQQFGFSDPRLACAPEGCVGENNQDFLAMFDVRPSSVSCDGTTGQVQQASSQRDLPPAMDEETFEQTVQLITDQIMAAANN